MKTRLSNFLVALCMVTLNAVAADKQIFQFGKASSIAEVETKTNNVMIVVPTNGTPVNIDLKDFRRWMTNGLAPTTLVTSTSNSLWANTFAFMGSTNVVTPLGMLTNSDTRAVIFQSTLTLDTLIAFSNNIGSGAFTVSPYGDVTFRDGTSVGRGVGWNVYGFYGNGANLTNIHGSNSIAAGTIDTNKMDATAYAAFVGGGDVTQAGLAAGGYALRSVNGLPVDTIDTNIIPIIFDSDYGTDRDDMLAIQWAVNMEKAGLIKNLAWVTTFSDTTGSITNSAALLCAAANNSGLTDVVIGANRGGLSQTSPDTYGTYVATNWPFSKQGVQTSVRAIRKALAKAETNSVVYVTGGSAMNLFYFLPSPADDISPLTGQELASAKIKHYICGAGDWAGSAPLSASSREFNFSGFSGSTAGAWGWLTNRPVYWLGMNTTTNITPMSVVLETTWTNGLETQSLYKKVWNNTPQGYVTWDWFTAPILNPEWMQTVATGIVTVAFTTPWGSPYATNLFTTNAAGNSFIWHWNVSTYSNLIYNAAVANYCDYGSITSPLDYVPATNYTTPAIVREFVPILTNAGVTIISGTNAQLRAKYFDAIDGVRFGLSSDATYAALNLASSEKIRWSQNSSWWGTAGATIGTGGRGIYIFSGLVVGDTANGGGEVQIKTNTPAFWPTTASSIGAFMIVASNNIPHLLWSSSSSTAWIGTNRMVP